MRIALTALIGAALAAAPASRWVYFDDAHHLQYRADERGNRIMDFSYAGYHGGGAAIPTPKAVKTLSPSAGDNTARIQEALDAVSTAVPDAAGLRGAVALEAGTYELAGTLTIQASGVVLRGSGSSSGGTVIRLSGQPHRFLQIRGAGRWEASGKAIAITDGYVPSGAMRFHVSDGAGFRAGDAILINHPVTER